MAEPADSLTFRPLTRADLPMLHGWLQRPHVAAWWREPTTLAELESDYCSAEALASSTHAFVVLLGGEPIGFIQSYVALGSGGGWWEDETDPGMRGIDQFLADESRLGRGLGSAMVDAFARRLFADPAVTRIQTDPSPDNERAIRCYRRAGFVDRGEIVTPDGPALLMVRKRPERLGCAPSVASCEAMNADAKPDPNDAARSSARGSCLCGEVRFSAALPSKWVAHCHCSRCRRAHGAAFVTWAGFPANAVTIEDERSRLRWHVAAEGGMRGFCGACGSPMLFKSERWPGELHIARALFLEPIDRAPQAHVFYETHVDWATVGDGLPKKSSTP